jgi:hypothetical protein
MMHVAGPVTTLKGLTQTIDEGGPMGVTYQTVRLSAGNHKAPEDGACVMELASMLAGEPFSDHPATACPVIAALLRAFNDALDDEPRQELYVYAAKAVGSRGSRWVEHDRLERLIDWTEQLEGRRQRRSRSVDRAWLRWLTPRPPAHVVAARAIKAIAGRDADKRPDVLAFVDELLALDGSVQTPTATETDTDGGFTLNERSWSSPPPTTP